MGLPCTKYLVCMLAFLPYQSVLSAPLPATEEVAYADRLIKPEALWADPDAVSEESYDDSGPARSVRLELVKTMLNRNGQKVQENGILFSLHRETENYGALSVEGSVREGSGVVTVWQRNLPFDNGWRVNNGLGMLNTPSIDLARRQYRFFVPTTVMQGVSTEWTNGTGTQISAGVGQPAQYAGIRVPTLVRMSGNVFSAGGQITPAPNLEAGIQLVGANGISLNASPDSRSPELSTTGALASVAWKGAGSQVQANVIAVDSNINGLHGGGWVDGKFRGEQVDHNAGIFRLAPGLLWGNQQIVSDLQGAYYRANYQSRQWQWDGGVDYATPVSGAYHSTLYVTGNGRYQFSRDWAVGGGANVQQGLTNAWSTFAFMDKQNSWGPTRTQINHAQDPSRQETQLTIDQTWRLQQSFRMSTAVSLLRETGEFGFFNNIGLGVYGGGDLGNNLTLDGNLQWYSRVGLNQGPSTYVNAALNWHFAPRWTLSTFVYENNTSIWSPLVVTSPIMNPALAKTLDWHDRGIFLTLRYDFNAGRSYAPLGGAPGEGGGRVKGILYFDQNNDGRMDAGDRGAANLTVILDDKFVTRTDAAGRFDYPQVRTGHHVITVLPDNLPLPWKLRDDGRQTFEVKVRDTTTLEIGAFLMR